MLLLLFSRSVVSDCLWPMGCRRQAFLSFAISWVCSNSCPLSWWCHPTISSSAGPFSSFPQSCPTSGSFPVSWLFTSDGQSIGASVSASVFPMNIQGWFPIGLTGLISLQSKDSQESSPKASVLQCSAFCMVQLSHPYMTIGKNIALTIRTFVLSYLMPLCKLFLLWEMTFLSLSGPPVNLFSFISWFQKLFLQKYGFQDSYLDLNCFYVVNNLTTIFLWLLPKVWPFWLVC